MGKGTTDSFGRQLGSRALRKLEKRQAVRDIERMLKEHAAAGEEAAQWQLEVIRNTPRRQRADAIGLAASAVLLAAHRRAGSPYGTSPSALWRWITDVNALPGDTVIAAGPSDD